jgi:hypothetical protein
MKTSSISKQNFKGLPVRLHFSDDHFVYVIPGSWIDTALLSPIAQDLLATIVANMNDQNIIPVHSYFKKQFASNYNKTIATSTIDNSLQQLLKMGIIKRKMNGIYEVSREYYIHKDGLSKQI